MCPHGLFPRRRLRHVGCHRDDRPFDGESYLTQAGVVEENMKLAEKPPRPFSSSDPTLNVHSRIRRYHVRGLALRTEADVLNSTALQADNPHRQRRPVDGSVLS
jgi:hypothetical protein